MSETPDVQREPMSDERLAVLTKYVVGCGVSVSGQRELLAELVRVRTELAARIAAESADAAAGSYAGRAEEAEAARDAIQAEATLLRRALIGRRTFPAGVMRTPMNERTEAIRARWDEFCFSGPSETDRERDQVIGWLLDRMDSATARAEQAEAALAEMRERLGKTGEQWGVRTRDDDSDEDIEVVSSEAIAREFASTWRSEIPDANPTAMVRTRYELGPWREADATLRTALERAAAEQGVPLVCDVDKLTAPEHERLSDKEWTAYAEALGIETGDEQDNGRDHTFEMLDDDAPKQNPRAVAEYWHEWADTCSNGGRDDEWTTVAQVVGRILAAMDGEQDDGEGGGDA